MEKGNKYANTALRIAYLALALFVLSMLMNKGLGVIGLLACLASYEYARKAEKNNTIELKKVKNAKLISGIVAGISILLMILSFLDRKSVV